MNCIIAIARNTFKEAVRSRILYIILLFALLMIGSSVVVSELSLSEHERIIKNLGFMSINLFGVAIAVFVGVSLVYNELEKRTIYTIVSKPISRWQFLLGKFFGLLMTIYVNVLVMTFFFLFTLHFGLTGEQEAEGWFFHGIASAGKASINLFLWNQFEATGGVMQVIAITSIELAMVTAFAILFSSFTTPTLSMFFTVLTFVAGRLNADIDLFAENVRQDAIDMEMALPLKYWLAWAAARVTPNLEVFHESVEQALYGLTDVNIGAYSLMYGLIYPGAILALAIMIFNVRNFK